MEKQKKTIDQLRRGDVIFIRAPFEENTRDYYNGHHPEDIRVAKFTDRHGQSSKMRMVVYVGRDDNELIYLPLTSKNGNKDDAQYQYELKDNSMTKRKHPDMKSYVELDSLRAVQVSSEREFDYMGHLIPLDIGNISHRLSNDTLHFGTDREIAHSRDHNGFRDRRGVILDHMVPAWEHEIRQGGYRMTSDIDGKREYTRSGGHTITRTYEGMVHYHCERTREQVHAMVSQREGRMLPPLPQREPLQQAPAPSKPNYPECKPKHEYARGRPSLITKSKGSTQKPGLQPKRSPSPYEKQRQQATREHAKHNPQPPPKKHPTQPEDSRTSTRAPLDFASAIQDVSQESKREHSEKQR